MKLAIVSSYNEECGAAFYSARLKAHLETAGHHVDILQLPVSLLRQERPRSVRIKADREVALIAQRSRSYDAILLQFEPGLFGSNGRDSYTRAMAIARAAKKTILTVHGFDRLNDSINKVSVLKGLLRLRLGPLARELKESRARGYAAKFWQAVSKSRNISVLTFCQADRTLLSRFFDVTRIHDFPITYFTQAEVEQVRNANTREGTLTRYGLSPALKYIGVVGFFGRYKGFLTAMKALEYLPDDYHLAIVGGEHPQALVAERDIGSYLSQMLAFSQYDPNEHLGRAESAESSLLGLLNRASTKQLHLTDIFEESELVHFLPTRCLKDRIHFLGQVPDDDMPPLYSALDHVVLPYIKTRSGQSGSGPATFAIEFGTPSLFSNAPVFREMARYFPGALPFFNVGNFVELAEAIGRSRHSAPETEQRRREALETFSPANMVRKYEEILAT
jgi:glycosyltransferase involved in cell wall biosynthesis